VLSNDGEDDGDFNGDEAAAEMSEKKERKKKDKKDKKHKKDKKKKKHRKHSHRDEDPQEELKEGEEAPGVLAASTDAALEEPSRRRRLHKNKAVEEEPAVPVDADAEMKDESETKKESD
jgi:hypothetical protein